MITGFYAGLLTFLAVGLAFRVIGFRRSLLVGLGDGGDPALRRAVRAHGNCIEHGPLGLVVMLLTELAGTPATAVHAIGLCLVCGRVLHAYGLSREEGASVWRTGGMVLTFVALMTAAAICLARFSMESLA